MSKRRPYEDTTVSADRSKAEIREILMRYGAVQFGIVETSCRANIGFVVQGRCVKIDVDLPDAADGAVAKGGKYVRAQTPAARSIHAQEQRRLWRAVRAWIFAQCEAVECGIKTMEELFLADVIMPSGERFAEWAAPEIEESFRAGRMPQLLERAAGA